jgi:2,5-diketo-D-gluconate reductase B
MYENEREVGEGLRASGVPREDVFITTKVWSSNLAPDDLARSVRQSVARLQVAQVDLLLIHWPNPRIPLAQTIPRYARRRPMVWRATSAFRISMRSW